MPRQIRHSESDANIPPPTDTTLGEVRRANLNGRLYPNPLSRSKRKVLRALRRSGHVGYVARTATSLAGWYAYTWE